MRELKFRAWIPTLKLMSHDITIHGNGECYSNYESINYECEALQYTGLYDKNGKGICEGDICRYIDVLNDGYMIDENYRVVGTVHYYDCKCQLALREICSNHKGGNYRTLWDCAEDVDVIGNIYENSELLEQTGLSEASK